MLVSLVGSLIGVTLLVLQLYWIISGHTGIAEYFIFGMFLFSTMLFVSCFTHSSNSK